MAASGRAPLTNVAKKALMAASGLVLTAYVIGHVLGNLSFFAGQEAIDAYAVALRKYPPLLWSARVILFASVLVHVVVAIDLYTKKSAARPVPYGRYKRVASSLGSRTMIWTGLVLLAFIVYHVLHLTLGVVHPAFVHGAVYQNLMRGLSVIPVAVFYVLGMVALGLHMSHGVWSMTQSVGLAVRHEGMRAIQRIAVALAVIVAVGFASIPITVVYLALGAGR
jgi:succinate dehydrogenase / fumarate reductase cytochrome b subunit